MSRFTARVSALAGALVVSVVCPSVRADDPAALGSTSRTHRSQNEPRTHELNGESLTDGRDSGSLSHELDALRGRRYEAFSRDVMARRGRHDVHDVALDSGLTFEPEALGSSNDSLALAAIDGDPATAWRGDAHAPSWQWTVRFQRVVHLGMIRMLLGDSAVSGVPPALRWEAQPPVDGICQPWGLWVSIGERDDRHSNEFLHGAMHVHVQRQVLFTDTDACALRLVIPAPREGDIEGPPVVREVKILESARNVFRPQSSVWIEPWNPPMRHSKPPPFAADLSTLRNVSNPNDIIDGRYEGLWFGAFSNGKEGPAVGPWTITIPLGEARYIDRVSLVLGLDAITAPRVDQPSGRTFSAAFLPTHYRLESSPDSKGDTFTPIDEAQPPMLDGQEIPVRRRLITLATPRPIARLRMVIDSATDFEGRPGGEPVVREISMYEASDEHPVVETPWFLSVDANPSALTHRHKYGESQYDGLFARDVYHRIRRVVYGVDSDTHWTADASRLRDLGTGEYLEAIEGDDPMLSKEFLSASGTPPIVILSGSLDWDFDASTHAWPSKPGHYGWNVLADARDPDRGMGRLSRAVRDRSAPFVGFCGGAQILALLDGSSREDAGSNTPRTPSFPSLSGAMSRPADESNEKGQEGEGRESSFAFDALVIRNSNELIRGLLTIKEPYERAWWSDPPTKDAERPVYDFDPTDPLFDTLGGVGRIDGERDSTREIPGSHGDLLRTTAFSSGALRQGWRVVSWSDFCRPWIHENGPEPTQADARGGRCIRIPQAFRTISREGFPVVGFQFHPEQRDFTRLAPGSQPEARGDAMNVLGNAIDLALEGYLDLWSK